MDFSIFALLTLRQPLLATVDAESLRSAVLNLALNAVEAAGAGGQVALAAERIEDPITLVRHDLDQAIQQL